MGRFDGGSAPLSLVVSELRFGADGQVEGAALVELAVCADISFLKRWYSSSDITWPEGNTEICNCLRYMSGELLPIGGKAPSRMRRASHSRRLAEETS